MNFLASFIFLLVALSGAYMFQFKNAPLDDVATAFLLLFVGLLGCLTFLIKAIKD